MELHGYIRHMKKYILRLIHTLCVIFCTNETLAQTTSADSTVIIEMQDGQMLIGKPVSDDGKEYGIQTLSKGLVILPKYQIKSISNSSSAKEINGEPVFENPHPSRYLYSPSAITLKKGDGYVQAIYYLVWQAHYALTDHWSIGATTSYIGAPLLLNVKYSTPISPNIPAKENQLYFATGIQGGGAWMAPSVIFGVGFAGFTYGNPESNITINGGFLGYTEKRSNYDNSTGTASFSRFYDGIPAFSLSFNKRIAPKTSLMGEFWFISNTLVGGPALRFYSGKRNSIDFAFLNAVGSDGSSIIGIPFISWTQRIGNKMQFFRNPLNRLN